jgi:hypothetical protein
MLSRVWRTIFENKGQDQMMLTQAFYLTATPYIKQSFTPDSFCVEVLQFSG